MDTAARDGDRPPAAPRTAAQPTATLPSSLAAELRTSVYLLGGALGSMTLLAFVLLLLTHWLAR